MADHTLQPTTIGDAPEEDHVNEMEPYVLHIPHEPFPMALVNREPYGCEFMGVLRRSSKLTL
jgi:hypothetical protein